MKNTESGIEVDVNQLTDRDAEIHEAVNNLFKICERYNVSSFVRVVLNSHEKKGQYIGMQTAPKDKNMINQDYQFLMELLSRWISSTTSGHLQVVKNQGEY
jgi:hypothetical protein